MQFRPDYRGFWGKKLPDMNVQWMERLLQGFLYDDVDSYLCDKTYRELLIADLKSDGLIEKKKSS